MGWRRSTIIIQTDISLWGKLTPRRSTRTWSFPFGCAAMIIRFGALDPDFMNITRALFYSIYHYARPISGIRRRRSYQPAEPPRDHLHESKGAVALTAWQLTADWRTTGISSTATASCMWLRPVARGTCNIYNQARVRYVAVRMIGAFGGYIRYLAQLLIASSAYIYSLSLLIPFRRQSSSP